MTEKADYLRDAVQDIDVSRYNVVPLLRAMRHTGLTARNLALAADLYDEMLCEPDCGIVLWVGESVSGVGLRKIFADMIRFTMVDAVVVAGATIIDYDFFEALGFHHYIDADHLQESADDRSLRRLGIRCLGGALVDEEQLQACQETIEKIAREALQGTCSSRELVRRLGAHLDAQQQKPADSIVYEAYKLGVPIFCPGLENSATGLGLAVRRAGGPDAPSAVDPARDYQELARLAVETQHVGLLAIGDLPGDFAGSLAAAAEASGASPAWKYAVAIASLQARDSRSAEDSLAGLGAARSRLLHAQPTLAAPLLVGYAYHLAHWLGRSNRHFGRLLGGEPEPDTGGEPGD